MLKRELKFDEAIGVLERWIENVPELHYIRHAGEQLASAQYVKATIENNTAVLERHPNDLDAFKTMWEKYVLELRYP